MVAVLVCAAGCCGYGGAQTLAVEPAQVRVDEQSTVRATGLQPGAQVSIRAELMDGEDHPWAAEAEFVADSAGVVDTARQAPVKGSYKTVSAMGLVWSMKPTAKDVHVYRPPRDLAPQTIAFHLLVGEKDVATAQLTQIAVAAGVRQFKVEGTLRGVYYVPAGEGKHAAVLVLGGSEGGMPTRRAAWLASHGYAALALCYFRCEGRPNALLRIPLEYFGEALGWLANRPEVDGERLGVMGTSRGGELALQLGSMYPALKAVVAYVPSNVRVAACCGFRPPQPAWTYRGQDLLFVLPGFGDPAREMMAKIAVEKTHGGILMIGAESDAVWPSAQMVEEADSRLRESHFGFPLVELVYQHAGHRAGMPQIGPTWEKDSRRPMMPGGSTDFGGTPEGNAWSTLDAIPKVLGFLGEALKTSSQ